MKNLGEIEKDVQKMQELLATAKAKIGSIRSLEGQADEHAAEARAFSKQAVAAQDSAAAARDLAQQGRSTIETILRMVRKGKW